MRSQPRRDRYGYQWMIERDWSSSEPSSGRAFFVLELCLITLILLVGLGVLIVTYAGTSTLVRAAAWLSALRMTF